MIDMILTNAELELKTKPLWADKLEGKECEQST